MSTAAPTQASEPSTTPKVFENFRPMIDSYPWDLGSGVTFLIGLDFGTTHSTCVVDVVQKSVAAVMGNVRNARVAVGEREQLSFRIPSKVAIASQPPMALGEPKRCVMLFGHSVDQGLEAGTIEHENVVDLLKLVMLPEYAADQRVDVDPMIRATRKTHDNIISTIKTEHGAKVFFQDSLEDNESSWGSCNITTMEDVVLAYLHSIWRQTRLEVAHHIDVAASAQNRTFKRFRQIFAQESHVAVSVPTVWLRGSQIRFLKLLDRAGFPSSTAIVSEAVSAAICHFNRTLRLQDDNGCPRNVIIADIGGSTTDVAGVRMYFRGSSARFGEIVPQTGSLNGSLKLNILMEEELRKTIGPVRLQSVLNDLDWTEDQWSQHIKDGFELTKRGFDNIARKYSIKLPDLALVRDVKSARRHFQHPDLTLTDQELSVDRRLVRTVYDKWLKEIIRPIRESLEQFKDFDPKAPAPLLALCGWGSLPPYILRKCRESFPKINVSLIETTEKPLIAQGNFFTLVRADLFFDVPARNSYGIRHDIPWKDVDASHPNYQELEQMRTDDGSFLPDRALWVVRKGTSLIRPKRQFYFEGVKRLTATHPVKVFPFCWDIDVLASGDDDVIDIDKYGSVSNAINDGKIRVVAGLSMEIRFQDCKIHPCRDRVFGDLPYIEFAFRIRVDCSTIRPKLFVSIPKENGKFKMRLDDKWREDSEDCHTISISLGPLHAHTNLQGNLEAKLDAGWRGRNKE